MDTRRHVSIIQPTSAAMLGLLGCDVGSQGKRDSTRAGQGQEGRARCDAAGGELTHHPQRVAVERPSDSIRNRVSNQPLG